MYNGDLHCRMGFHYFSWNYWSLFYDLDFSFSSIGEFIVCCSRLHFVLLQAAATSCSVYFICPGMRIEFICVDPSQHYGGYNALEVIQSN